ncbi:MAG: gamma-glutamyl-gamma-aminobutyrate hydrolase family protein [Firmicutes bacterium]|jgi:putative glutamine amidotransferase|nr:gamma-glutamyl-gamma-aminobutyrate hydrolase family protein [Bacillota bacterium]
MRPLVLMSCSIDSGGTMFQGGLSYVAALEGAGGSVMVVPPRTGEETLSTLCKMADAILLPGGNDVDPAHYGEEPCPANGRVEPEVDAVDLYLARYALQHGKPVLGICRGCQVLNVAAGGTLYQDLPSQWGGGFVLQHRQQAPRWHASHHVEIDPDSLLAGILGETKLRVNSFHHQAVRSCGPGMRVVAQASDGVVEAIEGVEATFALGVQWHPEGMLRHHPLQRRLFEAFIQAGLAGKTSE